MGKLDTFFPPIPEPPGQRYFETAHAEPALPDGTKFVALVMDANEIADQMEAAGLSQELENFLGEAAAEMDDGEPYSAVQAFISGWRVYGLMGVRFPEHEHISYDLSIYAFRKRLRPRIVDELTSLLECRADFILYQITSWDDDSGSVN
jgi:hypothetical protein